jgi:hypothetical protein
MACSSGDYARCAAYTTTAPPHPGSRLMPVEPVTGGSSVERVDLLGGLIHEYRRTA